MTKRLVSILTVLVLLCSLTCTVSAEAAWTCQNCGRTGNDGAFCPGCGAAKDSEQTLSNELTFTYNGVTQHLELFTIEKNNLGGYYEVYWRNPVNPDGKYMLDSSLGIQDFWHYYSMNNSGISYTEVLAVKLALPKFDKGSYTCTSKSRTKGVTLSFYDDAEGGMVTLVDRPASKDSFTKSSPNDKLSSKSDSYTIAITDVVNDNGVFHVHGTMEATLDSGNIKITNGKFEFDVER